MQLKSEVKSEDSQEKLVEENSEDLTADGE